MWISEKITQSGEKPAMQTGITTLGGSGKTELVANGASRAVELYAPYGYAYSLPAGTSVLLTECGGVQAGVGTLMNQNEVGGGEIRITALSGAYIYLKSDGSVEINGLVISPDGTIN